MVSEEIARDDLDGGGTLPPAGRANHPLAADPNLLPQISAEVPLAGELTLIG